MIYYLTTYIYNDILLICHTKWKKQLRSSIAFVVTTNGILMTLKKNRQLVPNVTVHIGKSREFGNLAKQNDIFAIVVKNKIAYDRLVFMESDRKRLANG